MQRALDNHPRKASSERALQEFFQAKQREFQERAKSLGPVQRQELDRQLQQEFVQKREELLSGLDKDIRTAVEKVSRDRGVSFVLDRAVVLYGGVDLTHAGIAQLTAEERPTPDTSHPNAPGSTAKGLGPPPLAAVLVGRCR